MNIGTKMTKTGAFNHISTLDEVVQAYRKVFSDRTGGGHDDPIVPYCRDSKSLAEAIRRACAGIRPDGKMFAKGSCVRTSSRKELTDLLLAANLSKSKDFDDLYDRINKSAPWGIGPMMIYDVSNRIGAWLEFEPKKYVYIHAGPLSGWKKLTGYRGGPTRIRFDSLPKALQTLSAMEIEDMLCEFREVLRRDMMP